jgi:RNA polymerase sigma-54 factor
MTPQLQQAIKLLQLSRLELLESIHQELETNPLLEETVGESYDEVEVPGEETIEPVSEKPLQEVEISEKAREDFDWESYLDEYNVSTPVLAERTNQEAPAYICTDHKPLFRLSSRQIRNVGGRPERENET